MQPKNQLPKLLWPTIDIQPETVFPYASVIGDFTPSECEKIIEIGNSLRAEEGQTFSNRGKQIRDSNISWLLPTAETTWIFKKLEQIVIGMNREYFGFELHGLIEPIQFTRYTEPGGKYKKHQDCGSQLIRKLSITIQLSDPNTYQGGDLLIYSGETPTFTNKKQGTITAFPSYMLHEVTPVTKGTRYSLVCWVSGPSFK